MPRATHPTDEPVASRRPMLVSVEMGYGHLRPAASLGEALGVPVQRADQRPFVADPREQRLWDGVRFGHTALSRLSRLPLGVGDVMRRTMDVLTGIADLHGDADLRAPDRATRGLDALLDRGLGDGLVEAWRQHGGPLVTTFYAVALIADRARLGEVFCLVTDADVHRIWAAADAAASHVRYFAPSRRAVQRLVAYGVDPARIHETGFPLPESLVGGDDRVHARANLARRLARLDPRGVFAGQHGDEVARWLGESPADIGGEPPRLTFAVGGAGAQAEIAERFLPSLGPRIAAGALRITLVAGTHPAVAETFARAVERAGLTGQLGAGIEILIERSFEHYYETFNRTLADTDVLWTKPSEMSFYAGLGLPIVVAPPLGSHERYNRRWLTQHGAGVAQGDPRHAEDWLGEMLDGGALAGCAWCGFQRLPNTGTHAIVRLLRAPVEAAPVREARA